MRLFPLAAGLLALVATAAPTPATPLPSGSTVTPETGTVSYSSVVDSKMVSYDFQGSIGLIAEAVVVDALTGNYDFIYQVQPTAGSAVTAFKINGYNNTGGPAPNDTLNVVQNSTLSPSTIGDATFLTGTVAIDSTTRSNAAGENIVNATFAGIAPPGNASNILIFQTDDNHYQTNEQAELFFGNSNGNPTDKLIFAPKGPGTGGGGGGPGGGTPEPASLVLWSGMAAGLGLLGWSRRRSRPAPVQDA